MSAVEVTNLRKEFVRREGRLRRRRQQPAVMLMCGLLIAFRGAIRDRV